MTAGSGQTPAILVADDDSHVVSGLQALLEMAGYSVITAGDGEAAYSALGQHDVSVALVDLMMPGRSGLELFHAVRTQDSLTQFIIITGQGSIASAVEAMKAGAYDYLVKPVDPERLLSIIPKAQAHFELLQANQNLVRQVMDLTRYDGLIGQSRAMKRVYKVIEAVSDSSASVLITGESGSGKELAARAIHNKGGRRGGPFVAVNCAALPKDILENELFGHEKGAFTGATQRKLGCFDSADKGTMFLDEIGDMSQSTQAKLLRALEGKRFRRLGGQKEIAVDVRVIAATHQDARALLREDLFFRLSVVEIELPPLRERLTDLPLLLAEFLQICNSQSGKQIRGFSQESLDILHRYSWPGNVRELRNVVERAVLLCQEDEIEAGHLPERLLEAGGGVDHLMIPASAPLAEIEAIVIARSLELANYDKNVVARQLGISLKTLYNKLERYGIPKNGRGG